MGIEEPERAAGYAQRAECHNEVVEPETGDEEPVQQAEENARP